MTRPIRKSAAKIFIAGEQGNEFSYKTRLVYIQLLPFNVVTGDVLLNFDLSVNRPWSFILRIPAINNILQTKNNNKTNDPEMSILLLH